MGEGSGAQSVAPPSLSLVKDPVGPHLCQQSLTVFFIQNGLGKAAFKLARATRRLRPAAWTLPRTRMQRLRLTHGRSLAPRSWLPLR